MNGVTSKALSNEFEKIAISEQGKRDLAAALLPAGVAALGSGAAAAASPFIREAIAKRLGQEGVQAIAKKPWVAGGAAGAGLGLTALALNAALRHQIGKERDRIKAGIPYKPVLDPMKDKEKKGSAVDVIKLMALRSLAGAGTGAAGGAIAGGTAGALAADPEDRPEAIRRGAIMGASIAGSAGALAGAAGTPAALIRAKHQFRMPMLPSPETDRAIMQALVNRLGRDASKAKKLLHTPELMARRAHAGAKERVKAMGPEGLTSAAGEGALVGLGGAAPVYLARQEARSLKADREKTAGIGTAIGAGLGAIGGGVIGARTARPGERWKGALIGGALGAGAGALGGRGVTKGRALTKSITESPEAWARMTKHVDKLVAKGVSEPRAMLSIAGETARIGAPGIRKTLTSAGLGAAGVGAAGVAGGLGSRMIGNQQPAPPRYGVRAGGYR